MMKSTLVCALLVCLSSSALAMPCESEDLDCWKRAAGVKAEEALSLARELSFSKQQLELKDRENAIITEAYDRVKATLPGISDAMQAAKGKWYESPVLWLGIGAFVGALVVVLGGLIVGHVAGALTR